MALGHPHQQPELIPKQGEGQGLLQVSLTPLALVKATPEKAYLSTTTVIPCCSFSFIIGLEPWGR